MSDSSLYFASISSQDYFDISEINFNSVMGVGLQVL